MVVKKIKLLVEARDKVLRGTMQGFDGCKCAFLDLAQRGRRRGGD